MSKNDRFVGEMTKVGNAPIDKEKMKKMLGQVPSSKTNTSMVMVHGGPGSGRYPAGSSGNGFDNEQSRKMFYDDEAQRASHERLRESGKVANKREANAIAKYTGDGSIAINSFLRDGHVLEKYSEGVTDERAALLVSSLNGYIDGCDELPQGEYLYRGVGSFWKEVSSMKEGDTFEDKGFQSFSSRKSVAQDFSRLTPEVNGMIILRAMTTSGDKGVVLPGNENEVLLKPCTWKVVGRQVYKETSDGRGIDMHIVDVVRSDD